MSYPSVAIVSIFRDHAEKLPTYIRQITTLDYPSDKIQIVAVEGDSEDETLAMLRGWSDKRLHLMKHDLGLPRFPSIENPIRLRGLSAVGNTALDYIASQVEVDFILWIESDLIWQPDLLKNLLRREAPAVAPMVWVELQQGRPVFYDTWGFRHLGGERFKQNERDWYRNTYPLEPFEVSSAGSCLLMRAGFIYSWARFGERAIISLCEDIRERSGWIMADPLTEVYHPWPN